MGLNGRYAQMRGDPERMCTLRAVTEFAHGQAKVALWLGILSVASVIGLAALWSSMMDPERTLLSHNAIIVGVMPLMFGIPCLIVAHMTRRWACGESGARRPPVISFGTLALASVVIVCLYAFFAISGIPGSLGWRYLCMAITCALLVTVPLVTWLVAVLSRQPSATVPKTAVTVTMVSVAIPLLLGIVVAVAHGAGHPDVPAGSYPDITFVDGTPPFPLSGGIDLLVTVAVTVVTAKHMHDLRRNLGRQVRGIREDQAKSAPQAPTEQATEMSTETLH